MSFVDDMITQMKAELLGAGIAYDDADTDHRFLRKYVNLVDRQIKPAARQVHVASGLAAKLSAVSEETVAGYEEVLRRTESGDDLRPFQSKALRRFNDYDPLLYDWGIHHLHLDVDRTKDPFFVDRSDDLLFAIFAEADAYFIDVRPHGEEDVWAQTELMRIVKDQLPELIEPYRFPYMVGSGASFEPADVYKLRKAGVEPILEIDGACYISRGGGITVAGSNPRHVETADLILRHVRQLEDTVHREAGQIIKELRGRGHDVCDDASFKFLHDGTYCRVVVEGTNLVVYVSNFDQAGRGSDGQSEH